MANNWIWQLEGSHPRQSYDQPACGSFEPHNFHEHQTMNKHFKMKSVWCNGICEWCFKDGVPNEEQDGVYGFALARGLHGNGAHK